MTKHTKGEWYTDHKQDEPLPEPGYWVITGDVMPGEFGAVADTLNRHHCISPEEDRANAKLIAAAPDMLEALQCLLPGLVLDLRHADYDDDKDAMRSRIHTVESALKKALEL